ncbi:MAG: ATP phosphoribosyltransferase [Deltaproteobacteria bacterium]|nr:ATP phosphoribosyltransferase [Deltaproteobacteria bacterium]MBM4347666.1 ATP phosphoribosyltransferase [Deltaproteobacteria bacterium]
MRKVNILKLGIPKGSLENATIELFRKSGWKILVSSRSYFPMVDDEEIRCTLARAQEMSRFVEAGTLDVGLTGKDWIQENGSDVVVVQDLVYSKTSTVPARWVLVVAEDSPIRSIKDLEGKKIFTELVNFTRRYFAERNIKVDVEFSWGATEGKVIEGLCDAIVEVTETGSTLRANKLRIVEELLQTNTQFIANRKAYQDPWKKEKIEQISLLLQGALRADGMVGLKMNVSANDLKSVIEIVPSITGPTISNLFQSDWFAIEVMVSEKVVRELIPKLLKRGAVGIIEYPLNKVI